MKMGQELHFGFKAKRSDFLIFRGIQISLRGRFFTPTSRRTSIENAIEGSIAEGAILLCDGQ